MARKIGAYPADVEDVTQEAFLRVTRSAASFVPPLDVPRKLAVQRWIVGILVHVVTERNTRARFARLVTAREELFGGEAHTNGGAPIVDAARDLGNILSRFHEATSPERWRAWFAFEIDGIPAPEIARQEGAPPATIYTRIRAAREDLAAMLEREEAAARFRITRARTRR